MNNFKLADLPVLPEGFFWEFGESRFDDYELSISEEFVYTDYKVETRKVYNSKHRWWNPFQPRVILTEVKRPVTVRDPKLIDAWEFDETTDPLKVAHDMYVRFITKRHLSSLIPKG